MILSIVLIRTFFVPYPYLLGTILVKIYLFFYILSLYSIITSGKLYRWLEGGILFNYYYFSVISNESAQNNDII